MKKEVIVLLLLGILLVSPLVLSLEQTQTYSNFDRFIDDVKIFFISGDNQVRFALDIREKEVNSAINNIKNQEKDKAIKDLERAKKKLQIVQKKVSLHTSEEIKINVDEIANKINEEENLPEEFDDYILEEEKTQLTAEFTEKTYEYCKELAKEDFDLMLKEEICNPETAIKGLEEELKELKNLQEELFTELMWNIRSCIDDPGTCNCEEVADNKDKAKCEKMVALAIKCEYKEDETSCDELKAMEPKQGDDFAESFVPDFLMNLFNKKQDMIDYDIEHSDGVPPECWNYNDKPECRQYDYLKEWHYRGENNEEKPGKPKDKEPTMQESVPECFDKEGIFLEEKCGKITIIKNEEGLINYIVEKQVDNIINDFENKSAQHIIDINGTDGQMQMQVQQVQNNGQMQVQNNGQMQVQNKVREIKKEMNQINNQIKNITYAPGTGPGGNSSKMVVSDQGDNFIATDNLVVVDNIIADSGSVGNNNNNNNNNGNNIDDGVDPGPQGIVGNQGGEGEYDGGSDNEGESDNEGDFASITSEVIKSFKSNNFIKKLFAWLF